MPTATLMAPPSPVSANAPSTGVHRDFEAWATRDPERIALLSGQDHLTYGQLNQQANALAHHLIQLGVGPDTLVVLSLRRSLRFPVAVLAILKAGGAYLPVDPSYPRERVAFVLQDSQSPVVLTEHGADDRLPTTGPRILSFDAPEWQPSPETNDNPTPTPPLEDHHLAYVLYTSGSTGVPKGVQIEHRGLANLFRATRRILGARPDSRWLASSNFSFDISIQEFLWPLCHGQSVVIFRGDESGESLSQLVLQHQITHLQGTPSRAQLLLEEPEAPQALAQLHQLLLAGEALVPELITRLQRHLQGDLFNLYGPTETTIYSVGTRIPDASPPVPIGLPLDNTDLVVVDDQLREVPRGESGELLIGGVGLARGYLNRPDLTQTRFIPHPLDPSRRAYRTGDLVRYRTDGQLDYLGRLDHQVKIRGYRIELGEIESRLCELPSVHQAAVIATPAPGGSLELVAYLTPRGSNPPTFDALRTALRARLPEFFVPSRFFLLGEMPMTGSGKTDRKALASVTGTPLQPNAGEAPRDLLEHQLVQLWQAALGWDRVGVDDDFFQLGGHSLTAMRIVAAIRRDLGRDVPWAALFKHRTVAQLAASLRNESNRPSGTALDPLLPPEAHEGPLSAGQAQMCFLHQLCANPATYNVAFAYRITGPLDPARLQTAWNRVVQNHESLRTHFTDATGEWRQSIVPLPEPPFEVVDLRALEPDAQSCRSRELLESAVRHAFDLRRAPLWRIQLQRLADTESLLTLSVQHALVDEWALRLVFEDLERAMAHPDALPSPPANCGLRYLDFAEWQRRELLGPSTPRNQAFWHQTLHDLPEDAGEHLPFDHPRPTRPTFRGGLVAQSISAGTRAALEKLAREHGCSTFMLGIAAFHLLLARWSGQQDGVIATPVSLRERPEFQGVVGLFLNPLPIRLRLDLTARLPEWLRQVRDTVLAAFAHGSLPSPEILRAANTGHHLGDSPLFRILFVLLNEPWPTPSLPGAHVEPIPVHTGTAKSDLALFLTDDGSGGWRCELEFALDLFRPETAERFTREFVGLLDELIQAPDQSLRTLLTAGSPPAVDEGDRFNPKPTPYPRDATLGELFSRTARLHPDREALVGPNRTWTYAELDATTDRLTHVLRQHGVSRAVPVGVLLERSAEFVLAALAVVKAGGVYVPLPPEYPKARLRQLSEDLALRMVLTADNPTPDAFPDQVTFLPVDSWERLVPEGPPTADEPGAQALDPAYVMFTSGSTGVPKGVVVPHRAIIRLVHGTDYLPWGPDLRFLHLAPTAFDASTLEIWGPLVHGGTCVIHPERLPTFDGLARSLRDHQITCLWLTAGLFNHILDHQPELLKGVAFVLTGGEALSVPHVRRALAALPDTTLINGYGPTEATTFTTTFTVPRNGAIDRCTSIPIGRPLANTRCHILNPQQRPVPPGSPGELYIGGDALALGYWNRPELTAQAFIPDPFHPSPDARLYRSGDRVRWLPDGTLEFLGRLDDQVKIRGFRIEPKEVESVLRRCPGVGQVFVFVRETPAGRELAACFETGGRSDVDTDALRRHAERHLPAHMIPAAWSAWDHFPLTGNGKTDFAALRQRVPETRPETSPLQRNTPHSPEEARLATLWQKLLGFPEVGAGDDFFALGGHSLLAMRLVIEIGREFGVTLSISDVLAQSRLESMAALIASAHPNRPTLQGTGNGPVLFFIPGVAGVNYIPDVVLESLARVGRFCDSLRYPGVHDGEEPRTTVPDLAVAMLQRLRAVYPSGPLCLAGYSLGGSVALEMARVLEAEGHPPALVLLYDAATPDSLRRRPIGPALMALARRVTQDGPLPVLRLIKQRLAGKLRFQREHLAAELGLASGAGDPASSPPNPTLDASTLLRKRVFDASFKAAETHRPGPYSGHVVLFRSTDSLGYGVFQECDPLNGWGPFLTGRLDREDIPGDHWAMLRIPGITRLAERTASWLHWATRQPQTRLPAPPS